MTAPVVVVGCGFGGLEAVRRLIRDGLDVVLVDRTNHHLFQPLLYQVATASLAAPAVSAPIRHILRRQMQSGRLTVLQARVADIDVAGRAVVLDRGQRIVYSHLVVASGSTHSYFGHDDWAEHAPGLKTLADAHAIRARIIGAFERAERSDDAAEQRACLTFVVVGGGPTGVELAGTLVEFAHGTLRREFRRIDPTHTRVVLADGSPRVLGTFHGRLPERARAQLEALGVEVLLDSAATAIDADGVTLRHPQRGEQRIATRNVFWAAGVAASPLGRAIAHGCGVALDKAGRVPVEPDLSVAGHPEISVVGDLAAATSRGKPVPGVSPAAKQMGRHAAVAIAARERAAATRPFRYADYGTLAVIGRKAAVVELTLPLFGELRFSGYPAWLFWVFAHLFFLIGFRNRLVVMIDWAASYITYTRQARVVAEPPAT